MAWLQNLAGKAEDLLNKIDQNAATVLNEPPANIKLETNIGQQDVAVELGRSDLVKEYDVPVDPPENLGTSLETLFTNAENVLDTSINDSLMHNSVSSHNSLQFEVSDLTAKLEETVAKLEAQNEELQREILEITHTNSKLQNDHSALQLQFNRANEDLVQSRKELNEYKIRACKLLDEKSKKLTREIAQESESFNASEIIDLNNQLKFDLDKEISKGAMLEDKLSSLQRELITIQQQYLQSQKQYNLAQETMRITLANEKHARDVAEEEVRSLKKESQSLRFELQSKDTMENNHRIKIASLQEQIKHLPRKTNHDFECRMQTLTDTLMHKQCTLDSVTSERNALKLQLEKLEVQHKRLSDQMSRPKPAYHKVIEIADNSRIPKLTELSLLDDSVTRKVKKAYSTLDAFSIRTGVFLRRYPLARIFLICYMILLHVWVLLILFTNMPGTR